MAHGAMNYTTTVDLNDPEITDMVRKVQPLVQPTYTVISYRADDNKATQ